MLIGCIEVGAAGAHIAAFEGADHPVNQGRSGPKALTSYAVPPSEPGCAPAHRTSPAACLVVGSCYALVTD
jgi:hypothetical protein